MQLTDAHLNQLLEDGYLILPSYFPEAERQELAAAQRRVLKPWDEVKDNPPDGRSMYAPFPSAEPVLNRALIQPPLIDFARRYLKTDHVHYRAGMMLARYPGFKGDGDTAHIDNGNNSLLPPSETDRAFGQIQFWVHLEEVGEDQAPIRMIPRQYGRDLSHAQPLVCPGGTVCIFTNYTWHAATEYKRSDGQRFTWGLSVGRADHYWEGFRHYTDMGLNPHFRQLISSLSAKEREFFRFPPAGHHYYTPQTLAALEEQYPGWNARGEYSG
jgi:hypothetical protein